MKKLVVIVGAAAALLALAGCLDMGGGSGNYQGPLFRWHYVGRAGLGRDGSATVFKQVEAMKETAALRSHFAARLGAVAADLWRGDLPAEAAPQPELLQPLLEDLATFESVVEIRGPVGRTETLIAVDLSEERARLWNTNLVQLARVWRLGVPAPATVDGVTGWAARRTQAPTTLQVLRAGRWTVVSLGHEKPALLSPALQSVAKLGRPVPNLGAAGILDLQADLPALRAWLPVLRQFPLPPAHLTMAGRGENVRTEMKLMFPGKVPWTPAPWQIPTNLVSEPLTSFTIARGVRPFLEQFGGLRALGMQMPDQFCSWGLFHEYGHTFFAVPQPQASNALGQVASRFPAFITNYFQTPLGQFVYVTNRSELVWGGTLPGVSPTLAAFRGDGGEFLYARLFPLTAKRVPPPAELYSQFQGRTNLVYYDWELSSNRVAIARQLYQLGNIGDRRPPPPLHTPSQKWLEAVAMKLGNSVTEVVQSGPSELSLVRKSQLGLTGFEMATLSVWLESTAFPNRIELPKPVTVEELKRRRAQGAPGAVRPAGPGVPAPAPAPKK